ncbi:trigger factor [Patescibacteria group bacterium]|nr:MAG: trigger factor [Patescibacteria group bacterium]
MLTPDRFAAMLARSLSHFQPFFPMQSVITRLPKSEAEIIVTLEPSEIEGELRAAAARLAEKTKIEGFRPGKAPFEVVKLRLGEMAIWQEAAEPAVRKAFAQAVTEKELSTVGPPEINFKKFAPGNPIEFSARVMLLPAVLNLPDLKEIRVEKKSAAITAKEVDAALAELQRMQTRERAVERGAEKKDKVVLDLTIERDRVPLEGGQTKNHGVFLTEPYYIPGFTEELVGLKKGDAKTFSLAFPETHFQKNLAGQKADFNVKIIGVYELLSPALDDEFAKSLGQSSFAELRGLIERNLQTGAGEKEREREEVSALESLVAKSTFEELPDRLVEGEAEKMVGELAASLAERGLDFEDYLKKIEKTREQIKLDFVGQAIKRIKTILALRELARREKIEVVESEVTREIEKITNAHLDDAAAEGRIRSEGFTDELRVVLKNRKTIEFLREKVVR